MKLSRDWLNDYIDLTDLTDEQLAARFTEIGHAVESVEKHGDDTVFDLEITTNRVDAMSHVGMARELAAALGKSVIPTPEEGEESGRGQTEVKVRIEAPEMCARYTALVIRGVNVKPSPAKIRARLEAVGLRPINNIVDATNYVMFALGHPLHAFDLDKLADKTIIVRKGNKNEKMKSLDGEMRTLDENTCVIADPKHPIALGGVIGGAESEISDSTRNVLLECAWFEPSVIRRTARRIGIKTDASYRFERRVDPNDTVLAVLTTAQMIGGNAESPIDVVARKIEPKTLRLRAARLSEASAGVIGISYALELFRRMGFDASVAAGFSPPEFIDVVVPTYRGDIHEEMDLVEEVLRFYGLNKIPATLPRLSTGDARPNVIGDAEDAIRDTLVGSGLTEVVNYAFIHPDYNALFTDEQPLAITNSLTENIAAMRLTLIPGLLESVAYNRSYGTRDGALFEVGRTYHRDLSGAPPPPAAHAIERSKVGIVMYGSVGSHWGDPKRGIDFFDAKGVVEQVASRMHVDLSFAISDAKWLRKGKRAVARHGDVQVASVGFLTSEILQRFGIKGDVLAAEVDVEALLGSMSDWKMSQVARFPGIPMIMAMTHARDLEYQRLVETIRSLDVPYLHEVGLRDRFPVDDAVKTTLGMWYQAFDRSLTQDEVGQLHQQLAARVADLLPVKLLS